MGVRQRNKFVGFSNILATSLLSTAALWLGGCGQQDLVDDAAAVADTLSSSDAVLVDSMDSADSADSDAVVACGDCDDKNQCTEDTCNAAGVCEHLSKAGACDDANVCTTGETCQDGVCGGGAALVCPDKGDANPCLSYSCDPIIGCQSAPLDGKACDDSNGCTENDVCNGGKCGNGSGPNCNDNNPCTDDTCAPATGCSFSPNQAACSDGNTESKKR